MLFGQWGSLPSYVINSVLGDYLENISADQWSMGIVKGFIELHNIPFRKDALRQLQLPVEIKDGYVGCLRLRLPYQSNGGVFSVEGDDVYVLIGPSTRTQGTGAEQNAATAGKFQALDAWEAQRLNTKEDAPKSMAYSMVSAILDKVQFLATNVHIRYEDSITIPGQTFAVGITIDKLSAQNAGDEWKPEGVTTDADLACKVLELEKFRVHWDVHATIPEDESTDDFMKRMKTASQECHSYIVKPFSGSVRFTRNKSTAPLRSLDTPRVQLDAELEHIDMQMNRAQFRQCTVLAETTQQHIIAQQRRKHRPVCPVSENCRAWWRYAIFGGVLGLHEHLRHSSRTFVLNCLHENVIYARLYRKWAQDTDSIACDEMEDMAAIERERPVEELLLLRSAVRRSLKRDKVETSEEIAPAPPRKVQGWLSGWSGWSSAVDAAGEESNAIEGLAEEEDDLLKAIQSLKSDESMLTRDNLFLRVHCRMQGASVELFSSVPSRRRTSNSTGDAGDADGDHKSMSVQFQLSGVNLDLDFSPRNQASKMHLSLETLHLYDHLHKDSLFPVLIAPQTKLDADHPAPSQFRRQYSVASSSDDDADSKPLFSVHFEKNPPHTVSNCRLKVECRPLDIVYHPTAVHSITQFFTPPTAGGGAGTSAAQYASFPSTAQPSQLSAAARRRYEQWKDETKAGLQNTLDGLISIPETKSIQRWSLDFDVAAPQVIIPESLTDEKAPMVVVDLGHLKLETLATEAVEKTVVATVDFSDSDDDGWDDDASAFATPMSTPPDSETETDAGFDSDLFVTALHDLPGPAAVPVDSNSAPYSPAFPLAGSAPQQSRSVDRLYDKYLVNLSDLQVMVGHRHDEWQDAHSLQHSSLHVVDRFTIDVQMHRRVSQHCDRRLPGAAVSAKLPTLQLHVDEQKIAALHSCMKNLSQKRRSSSVPESVSSIPSAHPTPAPSPFTDGFDSEDESLQSPQSPPAFTSLSPNATFYPTSPNKRKKLPKKAKGTAPIGVSFGDVSVEGMQGMTSMEPSVSAKMEDEVDLRKLVIHFSVGAVSVGLNSRGHSITELQLKNLSAAVIMRPFESSLSVVLHELLLVDALQKFGSDYELLVASKTTSCCFRNPHDSPLSTQEAESQSDESLLWSKSIVTLEDLVSMEGIANSGTDALMTLEASQFDANYPGREGEGPLNVITLNFSDLNIIANQETIAELISFSKRALPQDSLPSSPTGVSAEPSAAPFMVTQSGTPSKTDITASAKQVSIVVVRGRADLKQRREQHFRNVSGRQATSPASTQSLPASSLPGSSATSPTGVYTAPPVASSDGPSPQVARIVLHGARIMGSFSAELEVNGVIGGVCVTDLTPEGRLYQQVFSVGTSTSISLGMSTLLDEYAGAEADALNFSWRKTDPAAAHRAGSADSNEAETALTVRLASMRYLHSPLFLDTLKRCAATFQQHLASIVQQAAKGVALGVVGHSTKTLAERIDMLSSSFMGASQANLEPDMDETDAGVRGGHYLDDDPEHRTLIASREGLKLQISMESPVIAIPQSNSDGRVIVANLGSMSMHNSFETVTLPQLDMAGGLEKALHIPETVERRHIQVRNIHLAALQLDVAKMEDWYRQPHVSTSMPPYFCTNANPHGAISHILHDTEVAALIDSPLETKFSDGDAVQRLYGDVKVVGALRVSISKSVFRQVTATLDAVGGNKPAPGETDSAPEKPAAAAA
eukprot:scpid12351/ scgid0886/ Vacuolar protein sorting-associated protein 13D